MSYEELSRLVGREFYNAGVRYFAVAAGEEKLLLLEYDENDAPVKYAVAEHTLPSSSMFFFPNVNVPASPQMTNSCAPSVLGFCPAYNHQSA